MRIYQNTNTEVVAQKAAAKLNFLLKKYRPASVLLLLSGGSSLNILSAFNSWCLDGGVTIGMLDERFSRDVAINNFALFSQTDFFRQAREEGCNFIDTRLQKNEQLAQLAKRFDGRLKEWMRQNKQGAVIITQGVGVDGHTAGVMPYPEDPALFKSLFLDGKRWVVGYDATRQKNKYHLRVSVTLSFLRERVDYSLVYLVEQNKREVLGKVLSRKGSLWETPARIIREMRGVCIFSDVQMPVNY